MFILLTYILVGCALPKNTALPASVDASSIITAAAATAFFRLSEVVLSPTPTATETLIPASTLIVIPTSIPTIEPFPGVMRANANVRSVPMKSKQHDIGGLLLGQSIKVLGRNDAATWLYILYAESATGTGWVTESAVTLSSEMGVLPILIYPNGLEADPVMLPPFMFKVNGTPLPPSTPASGWAKYGTLIQKANVRIGPSVGFIAIGILDPGVQVIFTGRVAENTWVQIDYPSGPGERGWVQSSLIQANDGFGGLTYYDVLGTPVQDSEGLLPTSGSETAGPVATEPASASTEISTPRPPGQPGTEAEVTNQINVRSGPAQAFRTYGLLSPKDKVYIFGVTINNFWYRISYSGSSDGFGWVASQYLRVLGDMQQIPFFNNEGTLIPK